MFKVARSIQFKVIGTCKILGDDLTDINHDIQKRNPKTTLRYATGVCVSHQSIRNCGCAGKRLSRRPGYFLPNATKVLILLDSIL